MRRIYLVRHGAPDTGTTERVCLGQKDVPLKETGREEIRRLAGYFCRKEIANSMTGIFCSPLKRCVETVEILHDAINQAAEMRAPQSEALCESIKQTSWTWEKDSGYLNITEVEDFQEVNNGIWDGLTFREIKEYFPKEYEARGENLGRYRIPGGETLEEAGERFLHAMKRCMTNSEGDILVVTHAGVIRSFLCLITGKDVDQINDWKIPYGSVTEVVLKEDGIHWTVNNAGLLPVETITMERVQEIWAESAATEDQIQHMRSTAAFAMELAETLPELSSRETDILYYSALLHDMFRSMGRGHEEAGADWLLKKGYYELAEPVRLHNNVAAYQVNQPVTVKELLYYADKRCRGNTIVSIQERFDSSRKKLRDEEGRRIHKERMEAAYAIEKKISESKRSESKVSGSKQECE